MLNGITGLRHFIASFFTCTVCAAGGVSAEAISIQFSAAEGDDQLPACGTVGARAILCTTALLSCGANDVKRGLHGISYGKMFKAVFSRQFKDYAEAQIASSGVPVVVTLPAAAAAAASADELPSCTFKLAYWAAAALLYTTFAQLPDIAKQLSNVYSKAQLTVRTGGDLM